KEFLEFMAKLRNIAKPLIKERVQVVIKMCALEEVEYQKIETLSKGFKRRVSLAQALIHDPQILILDEPTDGLDPNQKHDVRQLIKQLAQDKCILISTHILEEVEELCDRCVIIGNGEKLFEGTPDEMRSKSDKSRIQDVFRALTTNIKVEGVSI
ncbi:MAG: ABC transporter ATP-binding protein, partial [Bacteriovoracia bacterium]